VKVFPKGTSSASLSYLISAMRKIPNRTRLVEILRTPQGKIGIVAASFLIFFLLFVFLFPRFGFPVTSLGVVPALIGAWLYGAWAGLAFAVSVAIVEFLIILLFGWGGLQSVICPEALLAITTYAVSSLLVGRLGEISRRTQADYRLRASLLEERQANARFLALLNDILGAAMETDDMQAMLKILAERTARLFSANNCFISSWDEKLRKTIPMAAHGPQSAAFILMARQFESGEQTLTTIILDAGRTMAIEDVKNYHRLSQAVRTKFSGNSILGLPIISGNRKLGAIVLSFDSHRSFTKDEIEHAELAARQVSLAITKALFLDDARSRVRELAGLHDISQAFSLHGHASQTFKLLTETLAGLMGVEICIICTYDPAKDELRAQLPAFGLDEKHLSDIHWSYAFLQEMWDLSKISLIQANSPAEIPEKFLPVARSLGMNSVLAIALWDAYNHLLGTIFTANKPGGYSESDIHLLDVLAGQVAVVIQNIRLLHTERTLAEQMGVLYSIAMAATQAGNEDQLIEHVTLIIGQRLFSDSFGILLLDEAAQELYLHSSYRIGSHEGLMRVPMGIGVTGEVAKSGKPRRVEDVATSPDHLSLYPLTRSVLCVPLKVESKMLGVVNVESTKTNAFTIEDEELLTIIAGQLATAIQRLRTVQAERFQTQLLERSNSLIRALAQVNARAAVATDPDGILQTLGNELCMLGMRCAIALSDDGAHKAILRYISVPDRLIQALERIGNLKIRNYSIPAENLSPFFDSTHNTCLVGDPLGMLMSWAPDFPAHNARRILKLIGLTKTTSVCNLPLITEGKSMGVLWMWGEGIHESDLPTMSLFASQLAAALQNANLLTEVGRLAVTDDLTGIYNRRHFFELAEKRFTRAQQDDTPLSALIVDLDHFKSFNDKYGHHVGDQVLRAAAQMMSSALRDSDIIGRYGGEEFSIILPDTNNNAAIYVAERLLSQVSDVPIETEAGKLAIQLSIGIAGLSQETPSLHSLIVRADQALYVAKTAGRNRMAVK
jgi:diguanylate cyclase (GGDEF)-like protein